MGYRINIKPGQTVKRKIDWQKLINKYNTYSFYDRMEVLKWMFQTSDGYHTDVTKWESTTVYKWITNNIDCFDKDTNFTNLLRVMFVNAIFDTNSPDCIERWKNDNDIRIGEYKMLNMPTYPYPMDQPSYYKLFGFTGDTLKESLNECHPDAKKIMRVEVYPSLFQKPHWVLAIRYDYDKETSKYAGWSKIILQCETITDLVFYGVYKLIQMTGNVSEYKLWGHDPKEWADEPWWNNAKGYYTD